MDNELGARRTSTRARGADRVVRDRPAVGPERTHAGHVLRHQASGATREHRSGTRGADHHRHRGRVRAGRRPRWSCGTGEYVAQTIGHDILPFLAIRDSRAPVIAAVNGICQAGGLLIAMMADIAVASDRATFRVPELLRGIPDATYAAALPAHVGLAVARDLLLSARVFDAAEAQRLGVHLARRAPRRAAGRRTGGGAPGPADRAHGPGPGQAHAQRALRARSTTRRCSGRSRPRRSHARAWRRSWRSASPAGSHPTSRPEVIAGH